MVILSDPSTMNNVQGDGNKTPHSLIWKTIRETELSFNKNFFLVQFEVKVNVDSICIGCLVFPITDLDRSIKGR